MTEAQREEVQMILCNTWYREVSADEAMELIEEILAKVE